MSKSFTFSIIKFPYTTQYTLKIDEDIYHFVTPPLSFTNGDQADQRDLVINAFKKYHDDPFITYWINHAIRDNVNVYYEDGLISLLSLNNESLNREKVSKLPGMGLTVKHPVSKDLDVQLQKAIIDLNDRHHWSREEIADWLDTLDLDLSFEDKDDNV